MEGAVCLLVVLAIVGFLAWQAIESQQATATTSVVSRLEPGQVAQLVEGAFGGPRAVLWTNTRGPGSLNKRRRGLRGGITMSIDIEPRPGGGSRVDMWASQTLVYMGFFVNFAGVVNRRKRAIARLLTEPT